MRSLVEILVYLGAFLLQPFVNNIEPTLGASANLVLCLTAVCVFLKDEPYLEVGAGTLFLLLEDVLYGYYIGPSAVSIAIVSISIIFLRYYTNIENILNTILLSIFSTWLYASVYWCIYSLLGTTYSYVYVMKWLPIQMLCNGIVIIITYLVLIKRIVKHRKDRYFK